MTEKEQERVFNEWLKGHTGTIFKIVRAWSSSINSADDLFQEIVMRVWKSVPSFRQECSVNTWIYRIALNTAITWKASEQRYAIHEKSGSIDQVLQQSNQPVDERLAWLYEAIQSMEPIDRSLALLLLDGYSYKEMAVMMGITETNIGVRIHRVKKQLSLLSKTSKYGT
ncbi:MAG: RNA polymerase sigma factor [Chitinophagaceae bacterium]